MHSNLILKGETHKYTRVAQRFFLKHESGEILEKNQGGWGSLLRGASTGLMQACDGVMKSSKPDSLRPADILLAILCPIDADS
jgi:hypothetical protein